MLVIAYGLIFFLLLGDEVILCCAYCCLRKGWRTIRVFQRRLIVPLKYFTTPVRSQRVAEQAPPTLSPVVMQFRGEGIWQRVRYEKPSELIENQRVLYTVGFTLGSKMYVKITLNFWKTHFISQSPSCVQFFHEKHQPKDLSSDALTTWSWLYRWPSYFISQSLEAAKDWR